ncbi:YbhB/YbcL [Candidatus Nanopelagicaceae bacterium]
MKRIIISLTLALASAASPASAATSKAINFQAEIWVDNWFSLYINGKQVGQDSVPITTEKSFNSEKIKFTATYPFTVGLMVKDFTENASGLEYIGKANQQIGDGGAIAQIRDLSTNKVVLVTDSSWKSLVINKAPLNPECVKSSNPLNDCKYSNAVIPKNWSTNSFKDSSWKSASVFTKDEVGVKEGYFDINWLPSASLIWSSDLKLDNTILLRKSISSSSMKVVTSSSFSLSSPAFSSGGKLPATYTCDGSSTLPPLSWNGSPSGTKSYVVTFDTLPGPPRPGETDSGKHAMFVLYNIPAASSGFTTISDVKGTFGQNFQGKSLGYSPPCSQGPGDKTYTFTLYAVSSLLDIASTQATEAAIEKLIEGKILASSSLSVTYTRG